MAPTATGSRCLSTLTAPPSLRTPQTASSTSGCPGSRDQSLSPSRSRPPLQWKMGRTRRRMFRWQPCGCPAILQTTSSSWHMRGACPSRYPTKVTSPQITGCCSPKNSRPSNLVAVCQDGILHIKYPKEALQQPVERSVEVSATRAEINHVKDVDMQQ